MERKYAIKNSHGNMRSFGYLIYSAFSLILLVVLILLPLAPIFASEIDPEITEEGTSSSDVVDSVSEDIEEIPIPESIITENIIADTESKNDSENITIAPEQENTSLTSDTVSEVIPEDQTTVPDIEEILEHDDISEEASLPDEENTSSSTNTDTESEIIDEDIEATTTQADVDTEPEVVVIDGEPIVPNEGEEDTALLEVPLVAGPVGSFESVSVVTDENTLSFSKNECVNVSDGSFYCTNATSTPDSIGVDRVFSAPDSDGDREIYIEKSGTLTQVSFNQLDDDVPYYDESSNSIVWHRLVNERYQIISYSLDDSKEIQITHDRYNNMGASRNNDVTVWQGWVGSDWEIFLMKGDDVSMITDDTIDDISPRVNGDYIIWQAFEDNAWRVKVFDQHTKKIDTIADADGTSIDNPRFVLVYDAKHENGDIETKGYDLETRKVTQLSSRPAPVPEEIPDPEQTGEDRALVQTGTQIKTKTDTDENEPNPDMDDSATTTATSTHDVIIPPFENPDDIATSTVEESTQIDVIPDIVIDQNVSTSSENEIDDLIITPYVEPIAVVEITE